MAHDPYAALRLRNFRLYMSGNFIHVLGMQMQTVAVGWEIYERTGSAMALGYVGLVQVLPVILLGLLAGHVADRFSRKKIVIAALAVISIASFSLAGISLVGGGVWGIYGCLLLIGVSRAFQQPAKSSLLPQIVPSGIFPNAVTWGTSTFQLASVLGPAFGGLLIAWTHLPSVVYLLDGIAALTFAVLLGAVRYRPMDFTPTAATLRSLLGGARFLWRNPVILGAITLDMFAVLLGGAVTLLPIYAKDILQVGPTGLGWLQAGPAIGALAMSFILAHRPPLRKAGHALLWAVAGFGTATVAFGLSRSFIFSLGALFLTGAFDNISVVIRWTLVQVLTPDGMRGRVSAINGMFIGASNELGGFESGLVAAWFGPVVSVVAGGAGTLVVVILAAILVPALRRYGQLGATAVPETIDRDS